MKKLLLLAAAVVALGVSYAMAGHFTETLPPASAAGCQPVSNGYDYNCTTDTGAQPAQVSAKTLTQINAYAPSAAGEIVFCSNCTRTAICVSTGTAIGAWVVGVESGTMASPTHCL